MEACDLTSTYYKTDVAAPDIWLRFLSALKKNTGTEALIAGGAVRDTLLGRPIKDVDVWVRGAFPAALIPWIESVVAEGDFVSVRKVCAGDYIKHFGSEKMHVGRVLEVMVDHRYGGDVMFNIIEMVGATSWEDVVNHFDFGVCRAWLAFDGTLMFGNEFLKDACARTFTYLGKDGTDERSWNRWERFKADKYRDWSFVGLSDPFEPMTFDCAPSAQVPAL